MVADVNVNNEVIDGMEDNNLENMEQQALVGGKKRRKSTKRKSTKRKSTKRKSTKKRKATKKRKGRK